MAPRLLLLLTLVLAAATAAVPALAQRPPNTPDARIADGTAQKALTKARASWKDAKIGSYRYEARRICYCPTSGWHVVNVRAGSPSRKVSSEVKQVATVPRLFKVIQGAIDERAHKLTVDYGSHGVPREIAIDSLEYAIDEEQTYRIRRFKRR